jgi:hypothetical protein
MSKTELKSCWAVPLRISDIITWLAIVQQGHESASALRFFPGSASVIFLCWSATLYLILATIGSHDSNFSFVCSVNLFNRICCQFLFIVYQLFEFHSFLFCLCSNAFVRLFCVQLFVYSVLFSVLKKKYWNCIPGILIHISTNIWQVN